MQLKTFTGHSLTRVLQLQWWLHTLFTSLFFIGITFFFLFSIEDYYNEVHLRDLSALVSIQQSFEGLPAHISGFLEKDIPKVWLSELRQFAYGEPIEIRQKAGGIVHLIAAEYQGSNEIFVLAFYTEKTISIWDNVDKLTLMILPWMLIFLALASYMARKFIKQFHRHFTELLRLIKHSNTPDKLWIYSQSQVITELAEFSSLFAQVWQDKLDVVVREKQGLEYLSHELRTPIQSSLATLELLAYKTQDTRTIERLKRSLNRMTRLSNAILCLMDSAKTVETYAVDVTSICRQLADEFEPLVRSKYQVIEIVTMPNSEELQILSIQEAVETLVSILLMNAIQHSNGEIISVSINTEHLQIQNRVRQTPKEKPDKNQSNSKKSSSPSADLQNYGIGLVIAQRLAERFDLRLELEIEAEIAQASLYF